MGSPSPPTAPARHPGTMVFLKSLHTVLHKVFHKVEIIAVLLSVHDEDIDFEENEKNLYKRDLLKTLYYIDNHESSGANIAEGKYSFVDAIKKLGLIIYCAGPSMKDLTLEMVHPLVKLFDNNGAYGKDVQIAALSVLSTMMSTSQEHQTKALEFELQEILVESLEEICFGSDNKQDNNADGDNDSMKSDGEGLAEYIENRETINPFLTSNNAKKHNDYQVNRFTVMKKQLSKVKSSVVSLIKAKKSDANSFDLSIGLDDEEDEGDDHLDQHGKTQLKPMDEKLVFWICYTLKTMCTANDRCVQGIIEAADSRSALKELLEKCSKLIEWRRFTTNSYEAWIRLTEDRDLFGDDQARCLMKLLGLAEI